MININLLGRFHLPSLLEEKGLSAYTVVNTSIGNDDCIYFLLAESVSELERGMFVPTKSNTHYQALSILPNWEDGEIIHMEVVDFGKLEPNLHFIQRLKDSYLLVGSRCTRHKDGTADKNALILGPDGRIQERYCFGDGIESCMVDSKNRIITSYFDEGIFGNYGWNDPIGSSGLILWSDQGEILWQNKEHDICDCYAVNLDRQDNLWFYYYTEFQLVKTNYVTETVWDPQVSGCSGFLIHQHGLALLFQAGYGKDSEFVMEKILWNGLSKPLKVAFLFCGNQVKVSPAAFRDSKALFWGEEGMLYYMDWAEPVY